MKINKLFYSAIFAVCALFPFSALSSDDPGIGKEEFVIASGHITEPSYSQRPTYVKDIAPIFKDRCVECHRPGQIAPMSFDSYENIRPWAKSILKTVSNREMPPWFADPNHGVFSNNPSLTSSEIDKIEKWVLSGSPRGAGPEPNITKGFSEGWEIGEPDMILKMPEPFVIPDETKVDKEIGVEYQNILVPTGFKEDKYIRAAEARPGNRRVVHHIIAFIAPEGSKSIRDRNMLAGYAPGLRPYDFSKLCDDTGILVPANSSILFQMHYTANGEETTDQSMVGIIFADSPPRYLAQVSAVANIGFRIPPNAENHYVKAQRRFREDTEIIALMPHMHYRGSSFKYTLVRKDRSKEVVLNVPKYDFAWQLHYDLETPIVVKEGESLVCEATFDNSSNNPDNPDPSREVTFGEQSWEEMMIGWFTEIKENTNFNGHNQAYIEDIGNELIEQKVLMEEIKGLLPSI